MPMDIPISDSYRAPLRSALIFSDLITVLSVLVLDGGETCRLSAIVLAIFWAWTLFAMWRRPRNPTPIDLFLIQWGCLPLVVGFQTAIHWVWHSRGLW
jgi:hypothetical protein